MLTGTLNQTCWLHISSPLNASATHHRGNIWLSFVVCIKGQPVKTKIEWVSLCCKNPGLNSILKLILPAILQYIHQKKSVPWRIFHPSSWHSNETLSHTDTILDSCACGWVAVSHWDDEYMKPGVAGVMSWYLLALAYLNHQVLHLPGVWLWMSFKWFHELVRESHES